MPFLPPTQSILWAAIFSAIVLVIFLFEYRRTRARLDRRENEMRQRMYQLSILRELGERIGYSLNVQKIVDIISGSLEKLLPYSTVAYMLPEEDGRLLFRIILAESLNKQFIADVRGRMLRSFSALLSRQYTEKDVDESVTGVVTDPASATSVKSFFNVPVIINNRPAGILTVASSRAGLYKTSDEVEILYTIMNQAADSVSKLETVLEIEKGKLNAMVASMADGVLMVDTHDRLLVVNPQTKKMLGLAAEHPTIFDILDALSDRLDLRTKIEESIKKDELIVEEAIQLADRFLQILITPVKDNKGEPLGSVVLFHDITHEKELEKLREDFTSMMVHELRSPLTGIRSIATLLKSDAVKNEQQKYNEFVELIAQNSSSMLDLVNDLLDVAKLESGKFEVFARPNDLRRLLELRLESFQALAGDAKLTLESKIDDRLPAALSFDENKISQVLNNLLSNAIKFTPAGGRVTLSAHVCPQGAALAEGAAALGVVWPGQSSGLKAPADVVVVAVNDTGVGIPQEEIGKLFNKFQQLSTAKKSEKKGTGLGLVVVKGVVEAHGGQVGVLSEEGRGTTFYFTIPLAPVIKKTDGK
ncbi:MAG: PAS domain S-box protein [Candidatus Doudnabacteria bacterium]|nr:PAS domain S-box protein [Candidatus Doudnabacteria bacterium]